MIDPALLERFTDEIEIPLPDLESRTQLLKNFIGKIQFDLQGRPLDDETTRWRLYDQGFFIEEISTPLRGIAVFDGDAFRKIEGTV